MYLAHPFGTREETRRWEQRIEEKYEVDLFNPFYDSNRQDIVDIDAGRKERYAMTDEDKQELVQRDLEFIKQQEGVLAIIDGSTSYGTIMEIVYAGLFGKPVFIIVTNGHTNHPWLQVHAVKVYQSFKEFERTLREMKRGENGEK